MAGLVIIDPAVAATCTPFAVAASGAQTYARACILLGAGAVQTGTSAASSIALYAGPTTASPVVAAESVAASGSTTMTLPDRGIYCPSGVTVAAGAGALTVGLWVVDLD